MTKEQAVALARARIAIRKSAQETEQAPTLRPQTLPTTDSIPTQDTQVMDDPLMVSDSGITMSPESMKASVRNVLQGVTFNTFDEIEAAVRTAFGDRSYDENINLIRDELKQYAQENPSSAVTQEIVGALMSPASLLKAPAYIERLAPLFRGGIKGGVGGGIYGFAGAEGGFMERGEEGLVGAGTGLLIGAPLEKAVSAIGNSRLNKAVTQQSKSPDLDRLKEIKDAAYEAVDQTKFSIGPGEAQQLFQRASKVADDNFYITMPGTSTAVDKAKKVLENLTSQGMTLGQAEKARRRLFKLSEDPTEGYIVRQMIDEFDDVIDQSLAAQQIPALKVAREANRQYKNSEAIQRAFESVDISVGKRTEGYRKVAKKLINNKRQMKFFTAAEREVLDQMARGTASQRLLNTLGKFDFSAKGLAGAINLYTLASAPWTALLFVGTGGAKYMADRKAITAARKLINQAGGVEAVKKASQNPNASTMTVGGVTADQIRADLLLEDTE